MALFTERRCALRSSRKFVLLWLLGIVAPGITTRHLCFVVNASESAGLSMDSSGGGSVVDVPMPELVVNSQTTFSDSLESEEGEEGVSNEQSDSQEFVPPAARNLPVYTNEEEASISGEGFLVPLLTPQVGLWALVLAFVLLVMRGSSRTSEKQEAIRIHTSELRTSRSQLDDLTKAVAAAAEEAEKNLALLQVQRPRTLQSSARLDEVIRQIQKAAVCVASDECSEKAVDGPSSDSPRTIALPPVGFGWGINEHKLIKAQASSGNVEMQEVELRELIRAAVSRIDQRDASPATAPQDESSAASSLIKQQNDEWLIKVVAALYPSVESSFAPSYSAAQKQGSRENLHMLVSAGLMIEYRIELQEHCDSARRDVLAMQESLSSQRRTLELAIKSLLDDTAEENAAALVSVEDILRLKDLTGTEKERLTRDLKPLQLTASLQHLAENIRNESQDILKKMQRDAAAAIAASSATSESVLLALKDRRGGGPEADQAVSLLEEIIQSVTRVQRSQYARLARLAVQFTQFSGVAEALAADISAAETRGAALREELASVDEWLDSIKALLAKSAKA